MQVVHGRCCGLDVHKRTVTACVLCTGPGGAADRRVRSFSTLTAALLALGGWLETLGVVHVALGSTGVYWRPVYNLLEEGRTLVLVNAQRIKAVPGRKTDVRDAEWLADLLRHGLLRPSFIPPAPVRELRELTRYRRTPIRERAAEADRLHKVLETANVKLGMVATDVLGVSGRAMLEASLAGEDDPGALAALARGRLRAKLPALRPALDGRVTAHHRTLIRHILAHVDFLARAVGALQEETERALRPCGEAMRLLQTIPGVREQAAGAIVAELGADTGRFASAKHLASWAGLCPGNRQSGGNRLSGKPTHGDTWLKAVLGEAAWVVSRTTGNYLSARYHRIARRRGKDKAIVAVAHSLLVVIYSVLRDRRPYADLGPDYFDRLDAERLQRYHVRRLQQLGFRVALSPAA